MIVDAFCFIIKMLIFLEKTAKIAIGVNHSANRILTLKVMDREDISMYSLIINLLNIVFMKRITTFVRNMIEYE